MATHAEIVRYFLEVPHDNAHHLARMSIARAMRVAVSHAHGNLLDIGCGLRPYQSLFAPHIHRYIGMDYPPRCGDGSQIDADVYGDSQRLPFRDASVDTALSTQVLEHLPTPLTMLREAYRVLRPGGKLLLTAPFVWGEHEVPHDYYRYTSHGLRYLVESAGFCSIRIEPLEGLYSVLGQVYLDELNLHRHEHSRRHQQLILATNILVNTLCAFLDPLFPSDRLCLTYLVVADR